MGSHKKLINCHEKREINSFIIFLWLSYVLESYKKLMNFHEKGEMTSFINFLWLSSVLENHKNLMNDEFSWKRRNNLIHQLFVAFQCAGKPQKFDEKMLMNFHEKEDIISFINFLCLSSVLENHNNLMKKNRGHHPSFSSKNHHHVRIFVYSSR